MGFSALLISIGIDLTVWSRFNVSCLSDGLLQIQDYK